MMHTRVRAHRLYCPCHALAAYGTMRVDTRQHVTVHRHVADDQQHLPGLCAACAACSYSSEARSSRLSLRTGRVS